MALFWSPGVAYDAVLDVGANPIDVRKAFAGLVSGAGVLPGGTSPLVTGQATFVYRVGAASWVTSRGASDGVHIWGNDGNLDVATSVAPGSGLSRIDIVYALHTSKGENGDSASGPVVGVAQGTAASSPVAPSIPVGALELARNTMTSAATSTASAGNTITQTAAQAVVGGKGAYPYRRLRSAMSLPDNTLTTVTWLSDDTGELVLAGLGYSSGEFTVGSTAAGYYSVSASIGAAVGAAVQTDVRAFIERNGSRVAADADSKGATTIGQYATANPTVAMIYLAAGDVVRVRAIQRSGSSMSLDDTYSFMQIARVR